MRGGASARRTAAAYAGVVLLALLAHGAAIRLGWTGWDDTAYVTNNPQMTEPGGLAAIWTARDSEQYYPLTFTVYWFEHRLFGDEAAGYHVVNVLLHAMNAALVLAMARRLGLPWGGAVVAAGLFACHPVQVMSVAWIAELKNVLSAGLLLGAMLLWARSREGGGRGTWVLGLVLFGAALAAKTAVLGAPLAWMVLDRLRWRAPWASVVLRGAAGGVLSCGAAMATLAMEHKFVGIGYVPDWPERFQIAGAAPWWYAWRLAWPVNLSPAYELWSVGRAEWLWWLPAAATAAAVVVIAALARRIDARIVWGLAHAGALLAPALGVVAYGNLSVTFVSDHFLYAPAIGAFIALAAAVGVMPGHARRAGLAAGCAAVVLCAVLTARYVPVFHDGVSMWTRGVEVAPNNYVVNMSLGETLRQEGRFEEGLGRLRRATEIRPDTPDAYVFLGVLQRQVGSPAGAEASFRRAAQLDPHNVDALMRLAELCRDAGRLSEAAALFERAAAERIDSAPARQLLAIQMGEVYLRQRNVEGALARFSEAVASGARDARARLGLAASLRMLGREREAAGTLREGLRRLPGEPAMSNMLALMLATSADEGMRDGAEAVRLAEAAVAGAGAQYPLLDTLAAAYAEAGRWDEAVSTALRAATVARDAGNAPMADLFERRADQYARRMPLRL